MDTPSLGGLPMKIQDTHCYMEKFVGEILNCDVLDTGCFKNVCGQPWLDSYLDSLKPGEMLKLEEKDCGCKFGDGLYNLSFKAVTVPATIGKDDVLIKTEVIQNDVLLLLSKDSMKKTNVKIDFANDKVSFLDQNVDIMLTSTGHYAVPINRTEQLLDNMDSTVDSEKVFLTINNLSSIV